MSHSSAKPLISVITPVFQTDPDLLKACLLSCYRQTDSNFIHIVIDNGSNEPQISQILEEYESFAGNAVVLSSQEPLGIAGGTQRALDQAETDYVAFLDHDDELVSDAIQTYNEILTAQPDIDVVYSDWDMINLGGEVISQYRKPAWSPERLRGNMYLIHFLAIR